MNVMSSILWGGLKNLFFILVFAVAVAAALGTALWWIIPLALTDNPLWLLGIIWLMFVVSCSVEWLSEFCGGRS